MRTGKGLVVGNFSDCLAAKLIEKLRAVGCTRVHLMRGSCRQKAQRLNWRGYDRVFCSAEIYLRCRQRIDHAAADVAVTVIATLGDLAGLLQYGASAAIKRCFFNPASQELSRDIPLSLLKTAH